MSCSASSRRAIGGSSGAIWARARRSGADLAPSGRQHDLADVMAALDVAVRRRRFLQGKRAIDDRAELAQRLPFEDLLHRAAQQPDMAPEMADIDAEDAAIVVHQPEQVEARPG